MKVQREELWAREEKYIKEKRKKYIKKLLPLSSREVQTISVTSLTSLTISSFHIYVFAINKALPFSVFFGL